MPPLPPRTPRPTSGAEHQRRRGASTASICCRQAFTSSMCRQPASAARSEGLQLLVGSTVSANVKLQAGAVNTTVEVSRRQPAPRHRKDRQLHRRHAPADRRPAPQRTRHRQSRHPCPRRQDGRQLRPHQEPLRRLRGKWLERTQHQHHRQRNRRQGQHRRRRSHAASARGRAGVQDQHQPLLRRERPQRRRRSQHRHQVRHQPIPRRPLRLLPHPGPSDQQRHQRFRRPAQARLQPSTIRRIHRRPHPQRQGLRLLRL